MSLALYRLAGALGDPAIRWALERRVARGKEDASRVGERLGIATRPRPDGPLVWLHAASVGESASVLPLISRILAERDTGLLVTTGTRSSASLMEARLPPGAIHQYAPIDRSPWVRRFLDHWRPDLGLWVESELWPNLVVESRRRGTDLALVNGRLSARSFRRWRLAPWAVGPLLAGFDPCLVQDQEQAERLQALGAAHARSVGNLKFSAPPLPADPVELAHLRAALAGRPVWVAASTHPGEERWVARAHRSLAAGLPGLVTIVAPRHPARAPMIRRELASLGLRLACRSAGEDITGATDIYLADTLGELGLFYRLAPVAFVGGSLAPVGGHSPIEPAALGAVPVVGPRIESIAGIISRLRVGGAVVEVPNAAALAPAVARLLADDADRQRRRESARRVIAAEAGALDRVMEELAPLLECLPRHARPIHARA